MNAGQEKGAAAPVSTGRLRLFPGEPLPGLSTGANAAFRCHLGDKNKGEFFGLVCDPLSLPRFESLSSAQKASSPSLVSPIEWQVADWPLTKRRHLVIAFERPMGGKLTPALDKPVQPIGEEELVRRYLPALLAALRTLHGVGIVHGSVNPTNVLFLDAARQTPMLGECVSTGVALRQPAIFAPVETAMAAPMARGIGQFADDVFGLGVTLVFLLLGRNPVAGREAAVLLRQRIDYGSYTVIIGENRIPVGMIELLRGMLADDPRARWTVAEIEDWLPARRAVTRQGVGTKRAARPFDFEGRSYHSARALAQAFADNVAAAAPLARSRDLAIWVQRAVGDENSDRLVKLAQDETEQPDEVTVARVCVALDYRDPLRFRDLAAAIDGFGGALASAFMGEGNLQTLAEAIRHRLPQFWLAARDPQPPEYVALYTLFDRLRNMVDDRRIGAGMERVLYEVNPYIHCLSPLIEADFVRSLREMLPALERRAAADFGGAQPLDRHSVAFVNARLKGAASEWTDLLSSNDAQRRLLGSLRFLARLQSDSGPARVPGLAKWIARQAGPILDNFHHRPTRKRLSAELSRAADEGQLGDLLLLIDNSEALSRDSHRFAEAKQAYEAVQSEIKRLSEDKARQNMQIAELAGQMAAVLGTIGSAAGILAACLILG